MIIGKIIDLIENTPNDQELGAKIREIYWGLKSKDNVSEED